MDNIQFVRLQMLKEERSNYYAEPVNSPEKGAAVLVNYIGGEDREHFVVMCLDAKNKINAVHTVHIGSLSASIVHPREVFKVAILSNASCIIVGHNHPSGDLEPSAQDLEITARLMEAGEIMGIQVLDHLIVGDGRHYSLKQHGRI